MDTRLTDSSTKFMEAIRAIQAYRNCSTEEAIELLTADISEIIASLKEEEAYRLRDIFNVVFKNFIDAANEAGLDIKDFYTVVPDSCPTYFDTDDDPDDVGSSGST